MAIALFNKGATLIALRPLLAVGGRSYAPGDVVSWRSIPLTERRVAQMLEQKRLGELSQESFEFAMKQRPSGDLPKGLTLAGLEALGIVVPEIDEAAAVQAPTPKIDAKVSYDAVDIHRGYGLGRKKAGATNRFDIFNDAGERLNPGGMLNGMKSVDAFIDILEAEKARIAALSAQDAPHQDPGDADAAEDAEAAPDGPESGAGEAVLTDVEVNADLEDMGVEIDPALSYDERLALRNAKRAERDASEGGEDDLDDSGYGEDTTSGTSDAEPPAGEPGADAPE